MISSTRSCDQRLSLTTRVKETAPSMLYLQVKAITLGSIEHLPTDGFSSFPAKVCLLQKRIELRPRLLKGFYRDSQMTG